MQGVTAYILAGGFGTRLRQVVADRPKVMAEVLGRPFLYHILDRLARAGVAKAVLCTGYLAEQLEAEVGPAYRGLTLAYSREDTPLGTGGALALALSRHPCELALALNGDSLVEADLAAYLAWHHQHDFQAALLLVPVGDTARFGRVETAGQDGGQADRHGRVLAFREKGLAGPGLINAGVYLLRPEALSGIKPGAAASIETDVFPGLAAAGKLGAFQVQGRFLDIGTPESFIAAGRFLRGIEPARERGVVFLDRDGTVIIERHYLHDPDGVELLPGVAEGLRHMQSLGLRLVLVTNQSGIGRGYFGRAAVERVHGRLLELLEREGVDLDAIYLCPHAPEEACGCRKPLPGLIERAAADLGLDLENGPAQSFVIGDKPCDVDLGLVVNATTFLVTTGYGAGHAAECGGRAHHVVGGLDEAARRIASILAARSARGGVEIT